VGVHGFRRGLAGRIVVRLDADERTILTTLVSELVELVEPDRPSDADPLAEMVGIDPFAQRPDDPALARLLPDAYAEDEESAAEFRRFTERSLRELKVAHARTVLETLHRSGEKLALGDGEVQAWLGTLNDLRLTLASRIGLDEEDHEALRRLPPDHPASFLFHLYDWLTFLQETLVHALTGLHSELPDGPD
jgi:hypothetical protein